MVDSKTQKMQKVNPVYKKTQKKNSAKNAKAAKISGFINLSTEASKYIAYGLGAVLIVAAGVIGYRVYKGYSAPKMIVAPQPVVYQQ